MEEVSANNGSDSEFLKCSESLETTEDDDSQAGSVSVGKLKETVEDDKGEGNDDKEDDSNSDDAGGKLMPDGEKGMAVDDNAESSNSKIEEDNEQCEVSVPLEEDVQMDYIKDILKGMQDAMKSVEMEWEDHNEGSEWASQKDKEGEQSEDLGGTKTSKADENLPQDSDHVKLSGTDGLDGESTADGHGEEAQTEDLPVEDTVVMQLANFDGSLIESRESIADDGLKDNSKTEVDGIEDNITTEVNCEGIGATIEALVQMNDDGHDDEGETEIATTSKDTGVASPSTASSLVPVQLTSADGSSVAERSSSESQPATPVKLVIANAYSIKQEPVDDEDDSFPCQLCDSKFKEAANLARHQLMVHMSTEDFKCILCFEHFDSEEQLELHRSTKHQFKCVVCPQQFQSDVELKKHSINSHPFKCLVCCVAFDSKEELMTHSITSHTQVKEELTGSSVETSGDEESDQFEERDLQDEEKTAPRSAKVKQKRKKLVVRRRVGGQSLKCRFCFKTFSSRCHIEVHERTHTKERPLECMHCPKKFSDPSCLSRHIKTIHKVKPVWTCKFCLYRYTGFVEFQRHLNVHKRAGEIYECWNCLKRFKNSEELKQHGDECLPKVVATPAPSEEKIPVTPIRTPIRIDPNVIPTSASPEVLKKLRGSPGKLVVELERLDVQASQEKQIALDFGNHGDHNDDSEDDDSNAYGNDDDDSTGFEDGDDLTDEGNDASDAHNAVEGGPCKCRYCTLAFSDPKSLYQHLLNAHEDQVQKNKAEHTATKNDLPVEEILKLTKGLLPQCRICDKSFEAKKLIQHERSVHQFYNSKLGIFKCPLCPRRYTQRSIVTRHVKNNHVFQREMPPPKQPVPTEPVHCCFCNRRFFRRDELKKHVASCEERDFQDTMFKCLFCDHHFLKSNHRDSHISKVHADKQVYMCDVCPEIFIRLDQVNNHKENVHTTGADRPFKCGECSSSFKNYANMLMHRTLHKKDGQSDTNQRKHKCPFCLVGFKATFHLNRHINGVHKDQITASSSLTTQPDKEAPVTESEEEHPVNVNIKTEPVDEPDSSEEIEQKDGVQALINFNATGNIVYNCGSCSEFSTSDENVLREHLTTHGVTSPGANKEPRQTEMSNDRQIGAIKCLKCGQGFEDEKVAAEHGKDQGHPQMCQICNKPFLNDCSFMKHTSKCSLKRNLGGLMECVCGKFFTKQEAYETHVKTVHRKITQSHDCMFCKATYTDTGSLNRHLRNKHGLQNKAAAMNLIGEYQMKNCSNCKQYFTEEELETHQCKGGHYWTVPCPFCPRKFQNNRSVTIHVNSKHSKDQKQEVKRANRNKGSRTIPVNLKQNKRRGLKPAKLMCRACKKSYDSNEINDHKCVKKYKCLFCTLSYAHKPTVNRHMRRHHGVQNLTMGKLYIENNIPVKNVNCSQQCQTCKKVVPKEALREHALTCNRSDLRCMFCHKMFSQGPCLNRHLRTKHGVANRTVAAEMLKSSLVGGEDVDVNYEQLVRSQVSKVKPLHQTFKCKCNRTFDSLEKLAAHKETHKCKVCRKWFLTKFLCGHNQVDVRKQLKCDICYKTFQVRRYLEAHKKTHFRCSICSNSFQDRGQFERHLKSHSTKGHEINCTSHQCKATFPDASELHKHLAVMHPTVRNKRLPCHFCPKTFGSRFHLIVHERIHTGEKPHKCHKCHKRFSDPSVFTRHLRKMHGISRPQKTVLNYDSHEDEQIVDVQFSVNQSELNEEDDGTSEFYKAQQEIGIGQLDSVFESNMDDEPKNKTCRLCGKQFRKVYDRVQHERIIHKDEMFLLKVEGKKSGEWDEGKRKREREEEDGMIANTVFEDSNLNLNAIKRGSKRANEDSINSDEETEKASISSSMDKDDREKTSTFIMDNDEENSESTSPQSFMCKFCKNRFPDRNILEEHEATHEIGSSVAGGETENRCKHCNWAFVSEEALAKHEKIHTSVDPYQCNICKKIFNNNHLLQVHKQEEHASAPALKKARIAQQTTTKLKASPSEKKPDMLKTFSCPFCTVKSNSKAGLMAHILTHSGEEHEEGDGEIDNDNQVESERPHNCTECTESFVTKRDLNLHTKRMHSPKGSKMNSLTAHEKPLMDFTCGRCNARFPSEEELMEHEQVHASKRHIYRCSECLKGFTQLNKFQEHQLTHIDTGTDEAIMDEEFNQMKPEPAESGWGRRRRKPQMKTCNKCGEVMTIHEYDKHLFREHLDMPSYTCWYCLLEFIDHTILKNHIRQHERSKKPYLCTTCKRTFRFKKDLLRHIVTHSKVKPFSCPWCTMECNRKDNMRQHCIKQHNQIWPD